jgi:uncharacterized membrane protein YdjX (TVP38/TMEM64 family)
MPLKDIYSNEKKIPSENIFWAIVVLRMSVPVDILSYGLGLFSKINRKKYILATIIGVIPFAFLISYLGSLPVVYQLISFTTGILILTLGWLIAYKKKFV